MKGIPDEGWEVTSYEGQLVLPSGERTKTETTSVCRGGYNGNHMCILDAMAKDEEEALRIANFAANARQDIPILIGYVELLERKLGISR